METAPVLLIVFNRPDSTQKVFDTYEDMVAFIEKVNKEKAESELY